MTIALSLLFGFAGTFLRAYVVHLGWVWFVLPAFGIPSPGVMLILGILFLISLIAGQNPVYTHMVFKKEVDKDFNLVYSISSVLLPIFSWVIMFLIQLAV